jgi:hypothetical protein
MDNESIRNVVMLELIAPEDPENRLISEEEGKALYLRYNEPRACTDAPRNWAYIFEPIKDENTRTKFKELFAYLDQQED